MAKIMLVEDDNNLREIYEARLLAEGHEIISAHDGEEALAIAVREKPELIISDVMMPKISGFDMLDILRSSPETKNTKIIMMTALSQLEDKERADRLGADRYLVKSQVTLEDVIRVTQEVLDSPVDSSSNTPEPNAPIRGLDTSVTAPNPVAAQPIPAEPTTPTNTSQDIPAPVTATPAAPDPVSITPPVSADEPVATSTDNSTVQPAPAVDTQAPATLADPATQVPATPVAPMEPAPTPSVDVTSQLETAQTADAEQVKVEEQINNFINTNLSDTTTVATDPEAPVITSEETAEQPAPVEQSIPDGFISEPAPTTPAAPEMAVTETGVPSQSDPTPTQASVQAAPTQDAPTNISEDSAIEPIVSPSQAKKVIQPLGDPTAKPDLEALAAKEEEKEQARQILASADLPAAPEPAPPQAPTSPAPGQKPDDPTSIAL